MVSDDDNQPVIMCPDESAKYKCDAGGINAIKVSRTFTFGLATLYNEIFKMGFFPKSH